MEGDAVSGPIIVVSFYLDKIGGEADALVGALILGSPVHGLRHVQGLPI